MTPDTLLQVVRNRSFQGFLLLTLVSVLWGSTFAVVKQTVISIPPSVLLLTRFALAAVFFVPFLQRDKHLIRAGLELGFWLSTGYATQTIGLQYTTANRSAFISALYVILLPLLLGRLGRRMKLTIWVSAVLAFAGVALLSYDGSMPNMGDVWSLATALSWTLYIWRIETFAIRFNSLSLTAVQLWVLVGFALVWVLISHPLWLAPVLLVSKLPWLSVLYLGIATTALTTWMQTWGQSKVSAPLAAIIYCQEPIWASLFAYVVLGEVLGRRGWLGASLVVAAILITEFPFKLNRQK